MHEHYRAPCHPSTESSTTSTPTAGRVATGAAADRLARSNHRILFCDLFPSLAQAADINFATPLRGK